MTKYASTEFKGPQVIVYIHLSYAYIIYTFILFSMSILSCLILHKKKREFKKSRFI